jgi:diacylglycerol kinase family enzyme
LAGYLIVNPRSGEGRPTAEELAAEARLRGIEVHILGPNDDVAALAREAADADALGMAGGDGSLGAVAEAAIERGLPFVCIPFGTRNHFARDLGLDRDDPLGALAAFGSDDEQRIDIGRIGDRVFLNNVSFGVYARLVYRRESHRRRREALARLRALWLSLRDRHPEPLVVDGERVNARIVLVANNAYELDLFTLGERARLDEGNLHAYLAEGWLPRDWDERVADSFQIEHARDGLLLAAVDGEPSEHDSPVELRIDPRALRVLMPPKA